MRILLGLFVVGACGTQPNGGDDTVDPPVTRSAIEQCVAGGGAIAEAWSVGNQHGPVTSVVAGELIVLGSADGSVKQWTIEGDEPSYGTPFTTAGQSVTALALGDAHIHAGAANGTVSEWRLADATATASVTLADVTASALAASGDTVIIGTDVTRLYSLSRGSSTPTELTTELWGVWSIQFAANDTLVTAGHYYSIPLVERRAASNPTEVIDRWLDEDVNDDIRAVALDGAAKTLVAAADNYVAVLAAGDLAAGPIARTELAEHGTVGAVMLPGGELFATAGKDGTLRVWKTATAELVSTLSIPEPVGLVADRDGTRLYTSGPDGRLHAFGCR